ALDERLHRSSLGAASRAPSLVQPVRHQHCVNGTATAAEVVAPQALALEAELFIKLDCRLVVREHVQLELFDSGLTGPFDRTPELDQRRGIGRCRTPDDVTGHTMTPWPPRRGSPAASRLPSSRSSTAAAPPK